MTEIIIFAANANKPIHNKVMAYSAKTSLAIKKEKQAISMIEQEIERQNK